MYPYCIDFSAGVKRKRKTPGEAKKPLAFSCRLLYHTDEHNWIICLRGGAKFPTGGDSPRASLTASRNRRNSGTDSIVWMREGVYGIFVMLFFDACTLGDKRFQGCYTIERESFFMTQHQKTHRLAVAAMLTAVAAVLQFIEFAIPLMPAFIKLDISDLPALLGTFSLGPVYGVAIQLVKNLLHLPFGSSAGVGELSNFILGAIFVFTAGMIYKRSKSRKSALIGSLAGAVAMALISIVANYFIVYPAYVVLYNLPLEAIVGMYEEILGGVSHMPTQNALFNCLLVFNVPFTFVKGMLDVALCFAIYKPLSPLLHK